MKTEKLLKSFELYVHEEYGENIPTGAIDEFIRNQNRDVDELKDKILVLLKEYNSQIEYCSEMNKVILVDLDSNNFVEIGKELI